MQRSDYIDFCKGILILLVSIGHAAQCAAYQEIDFFQDPTFKAIYMFHMPLFMAISGYVSFHSIRNSPPGKFVYTKAVAFLIPIFVWEILFKISTILVFKKDFPIDLPIIIISEAVQSLWFLWVLLASLTLTAIANKFGKFSLLISAAIFIASLFIPDHGILPLFKYTYPFFLIGYYIAGGTLVSSLISARKSILPISGIISVALFYMWAEPSYVYVTGMALSWENLPNIALRYTAGVITSAFALCIIYITYQIINEKLKSLIISFGKDSLYIYIISQYAFIFVTKISARFFERADNHLEAAMVALSIGILITWACWTAGNLIVKNHFAAKLLFGKSINTKK